MEDEFALFVDVMGVQRDLVEVNNSGASSGFTRCQEKLRSFRGDLERVVGSQLELLSMADPSVAEPSFVAEFSDSAYIVGKQFASVAIAGVSLMRSALRHEYPLRGGIGIGSFSHEQSGVRTIRGGQVWTTNSFFGGAVVRAYQAERCSVPGLRIFIHPLVMQNNAEPSLQTYATPLLEEGSPEGVSHELRIWRSEEVAPALSRLQAFRGKENPPGRALRHYDATVAAYTHFAKIVEELPGVLPAIWL
jgi:hypothetical protein